MQAVIFHRTSATITGNIALALFSEDLFSGRRLGGRSFLKHKIVFFESGQR
jgi:hypothetical protein